jgi:glycosidase
LVLWGLESELKSLSNPLESAWLQGFNWESWKQSGGWYNMMMGKVDDIAAAGVTHVWLPPPSHSVSNEGPQSLPLSPNPFVAQHLEAKGKDKAHLVPGN